MHHVLFCFDASLVLQRRADLKESTDQKPTFDSLRQSFGRASTPVMEKHDSRLFVRHVLVDGDNLDLVLEQRL